MSNIFFLQIITAFVVGGALIGVLSVIAERVPQRVAGIVLSLPTSMAIAYFFMGIMISPSSIAEAALVVPFSLGASTLFIVVYVYAANFFKKNISISILFGVVLGIGLWCALSVPLAIYSVRNIILSLSGYIVFIAVGHYFLAIFPKKQTHAIHISFTVKEVCFRALFGGTLIATIIFLAKTFGPLWGGIMSVFPAATLSALLIVHVTRGAPFLFHVAKTMPIASTIFLVYTLVAVYSFPIFGVVIGTLICYFVSVIYMILLEKIMRLYGMK